jgi:alpha-beta hydrolase superfamily lysophospholipase
MPLPSHFPSIPPFWQEKVCRIKKDQIFLRLWENSNKINKIMFIIHGWGEHSGRYLHFSHYLRDEYGLIAVIDLPGHGGSEGNRGDIQKQTDLFEAVFAGIQYAQDYYKLSRKEVVDPYELHLFGHSFGGLLAILTSIGAGGQKVAHQKLILSAPLIEFAKPIAPHKLLLGFVGDKIFPRLPFKTDVDLNQISRDVAVVKAVHSDSLCHQKITPRSFRFMLEMMSVAAEAKELPVSTCLFLPLEDRIVSSAQTQLWFDQIKVTEGQKVLNSFPGGFHELFNDDCRFQAFTALQKFVSS